MHAKSKVGMLSKCRVTKSVNTNTPFAQTRTTSHLHDNLVEQGEDAVKYDVESVNNRSDNNIDAVGKNERVARVWNGLLSNGNNLARWSRWKGCARSWTSEHWNGLCSFTCLLVSRSYQHHRRGHGMNITEPVIKMNRSLSLPSCREHTIIHKVIPQPTSINWIERGQTYTARQWQGRYIQVRDTLCSVSYVSQSVRHRVSK